MINTRNEIPSILSDNSIGCELGVFEGEFSEQLWLSNKFHKLYLVDRFSGPASNFGKNYFDSSVLYHLVKNKFADYTNISVLKQDSISFLKSTQIKFDFIYIDTIHSYTQLSQELSASMSCINRNGYICGHDYCLEFPGVIEAVSEFCEKYRYEPIITKEHNYPSFIIHIV